MIEQPVKGMVLCTKNSQYLTNAVVVSVEGKYTELLSDFGNLIKIPTETLSDYYEVSENWLNHQMYLDELGVDANETLEERIKSQINNLEDSLSKLSS